MTVEISINNRKYVVSKDITVLEACKQAGIEIPTLCREKERERPFTSCFVCLVEIEGLPRFVPSCGTKVRDGLVIKVDNERVFNARKTGLELLLSDHNADCKPPCHWKCPAHADVQGYVNAIANREFKTSIEVLRKRIPLPATLGRVCPHPCEDDCRRNYVDKPVSIKNLKRFVADWDQEYGPFMPEAAPETGKKIAVIGGGPAGLSCAYYLRLSGHSVTIFEQMPALGGMLRYGIPEYRLPKGVLDREINSIVDLGINVHTNSKLGVDIHLDDLERDFDAVFLGIGAWKAKSIRLEGEDHPQVIGGIDFLRDVVMGRQANIGKEVVVVGGGNTAIDAARTTIRMGSSATILYRRTEAEMPAEKIEVKDAMEEGVHFEFLASPIGFVFKGDKLTGIRCQRMELGDPDSSGRRRPQAIEGSEFVLKADAVIKAIGQDIQKGIISEEEVDQTKWGTVNVQMPIYKTNRKKVFAGGDIVKGPALVVDAVYMGRKASESINCMLKGEVFPATMDLVSTRKDVDESLYEDEERKERVEPTFVEPKVRASNFQEVDKGFTEEEAVTEANRCMSCGCQDLFECKLKRYMNDYQADPDRFEGSTHDYPADDSHPFILREPNKCVKCGKCVEVCDRSRGLSVYGFANRGFDATIVPSLDRPLNETDCISCGDCVAVCPVGALTEKIPLNKPGPFETEVTSSVCTKCSVGCSIDVHVVDEIIYKITPHIEGWNNVHMCETGRFDHAWMNDPSRFKVPRMKVAGEWKDVRWDKAIDHMADLLKEEPQIILRPTCTNEEAYLAREIVNRLAGEIYLIVDDHETCDGLQAVLGNAGSTITFDDIEKQDHVLVYNTDLVNRWSVAGVKLRQAAEKGVEVIIAGDKPHRIDNAKVFPKADIDFLDALIATAVREQLITGHAYDQISYREQDLLNDLAMLSKSDIENKSNASYQELSEIARALSTNNGLIYFGLADSEESRRIALFKQITEARLMVLKRGSNSQGIADLGIPRITLKELEGLSRKNILMFGYPPEDFKRPESCRFLAIQRTLDPMDDADVIIPRSVNYENDGTVVTTDRRLCRIRKGLLAHKENWSILLDLAKALDIDLGLETVEDITEALLPELKSNRDDRFL
ncbi:MAG: NAD(P)-binding protein [Thermoplasmatota archaeon]